MQWVPPVINPVHHSEILEYYIDCLPDSFGEAEEAQLEPVPASPATVAPHAHTLGDGENEKEDTFGAPLLDYIHRKFTDMGVERVSFTNLTPACRYRIRTKCRSLSGWSKFCQTITVTTLCYVPDPPEPVDICKVSTNGLLLSWQRPHSENGLSIDYYQIELIDAKMAIPIMEMEEQEQEPKSTDKEKRVAAGGTDRGGVTCAASTGGSKNNSSSILNKRLPMTGVPAAATEKKGVASKWHRLVRHKNLLHLNK